VLVHGRKPRMTSVIRAVPDNVMEFNEGENANLRPQGDALMIRYMAAVPLLLAAMSAQNVPSTNKGRHLDIPAISREANGSIVSIVMSNKDGHPIAQGSGFLISKDGHVVTNYHVIKSGTSAVVKLPDGAFFPVDGVLTSDKGRDVAIIKAHGNDFHTLTLGDSDRLQVGEEVVAIGSPLSLESTVSNGIVSAIRTVEDEGGKFVQITAPISPGSSGGPLFNMAGEVVGITTAGLRGGENLNFAIPINDAKLMLRATFSTASALPDEVDEAENHENAPSPKVGQALTPSTGNKLTGNELIVACHAVVRMADQPTATYTMGEYADARGCIGLVSGAMAGLDVGNLIDTKGATVAQGIRVVDKYLTEHPEMLNRRDTFLVMRALLTAFPRRAK
jgi:S1-C subfamily serine protease